MSFARSPEARIVLEAHIIAVVDEAPRVLVEIQSGAATSLPRAPFDIDTDADLVSTLSARMHVRCGLELGAVEQLVTDIDATTNPHMHGVERRTLTIAWLAPLSAASEPVSGLSFADIYAALPWEDRRSKRADEANRHLAAALQAWAVRDIDRSTRVARLFALEGKPWLPAAAAARCVLLREAGVVLDASSTAHRAAMLPAAGPDQSLSSGQRLRLALALDRLRQRALGVPDVAALLPAEFTLLSMQRVTEAILGQRLHKQNFRRLVETARLVEATGRYATSTRGRPAEFFRFAH
jgi:hypothetical protein